MQRGHCRHRFANLVRLSWLSPTLVEMILKGSQPEGLTIATLIAMDLPMSWAEQEKLLLSA